MEKLIVILDLSDNNPKMDDSITRKFYQSSMIFLHIPKAAGSTLTRILEHQYRGYSIWQTANGDFRNLPVEKRMNCRLIVGHCNLKMKLHQYMSQPCTYITMLREPVDRVLSLYYYIRANPSHSLYPRVSQLSIEHCFAEKLSPFSNLQTRLITAHDSKEEFGLYNDKQLESAKRNLIERFALVGFTEEFDQFVTQLNETFGWNIQGYQNVCVTKTRPRRHQISKDTLSVIEKYNQMDIELYSFAKEHIQY